MIEAALTNLHYDQWSWIVPWIFALSVIVFVGSILGVGWMLVRLPVDYISRECPSDELRSKWTPGRLAKKAVCNLAGVGFMCIGIVMLFTPGQGILSILVGLTLLDFPGKRQLIRRVLTTPRVLNAVNKLRKKADKPPLTLPLDGNSSTATENLVND